MLELLAGIRERAASIDLRLRQRGFELRAKGTYARPFRANENACALATLAIHRLEQANATSMISCLRRRRSAVPEVASTSTTTIWSTVSLHVLGFDNRTSEMSPGTVAPRRGFGRVPTGSLAAPFAREAARASDCAKFRLRSLPSVVQVYQRSAVAGIPRPFVANLSDPIAGV